MKNSSRDDSALSGRIRLLPDHVKRKIAAGEVVEGPFSVLKELLENSVDSGATAIDVDISGGGLKRISVKDNGRGIVREDLALLLQEHATSKIGSLEDLENILTFGFRGEALSSISAISRLTLCTRSVHEDIGGRLVSSEGGLEISDFAGPSGTLLIVENLFYNVPARKKFLKSPPAEMRALRETFLRTALPHPEISFSLSSDGERQLTLPAVADLPGRIGQIYGAAVRDNLHHARIDDPGMRLEGYLSGPDFSKSSRSLQILYVNRRPIEYRYLGFLLTRAYEAVLSRGQHPAALLFMDVSPDLIDVNIHPAKREIKFRDQKRLDGLIIHMAREVLGGRVHSVREDLFREPAPEQGLSGSGLGREPFRESKTLQQDLFREGVMSGREETPPPTGEGVSHREMLRDVHDLYRVLREDDGIRVLNLLFDAYILAEYGETLHIIDFHAAHERLLFDDIMARDFQPESQELIFPVVRDMGLEELKAVAENIGLFSEIGFDIEEFSDHSIIIRAVPFQRADWDVEKYFQETAEALAAGNYDPAERKRIIAAKTACHAARRAGDGISEGEMHSLVRKILLGEHEMRCPHGRPLVYKLEKKDLEKIFRRS